MWLINTFRTGLKYVCWNKIKLRRPVMLGQKFQDAYMGQRSRKGENYFRLFFIIRRHCVLLLSESISKQAED